MAEQKKVNPFEIIAFILFLNFLSGFIDIWMPMVICLIESIFIILSIIHIRYKKKQGS
jgi:hypothetical protein